MIFLPGCSCCGGGGGSDRLCAPPDICSYSINVKTPSALAMATEFTGCGQPGVSSTQFEVLDPAHSLSMPGWVDKLEDLAPCYRTGELGQDSLAGRTVYTGDQPDFLQAYVQHRGGYGRCADNPAADRAYWQLYASVVIYPLNPYIFDLDKKSWTVDLSLSQYAQVVCDQDGGFFGSTFLQYKSFSGQIPYTCQNTPDRTCDGQPSEYDFRHIETPLTISISDATTSLGDWTVIDGPYGYDESNCDGELNLMINHLFSAQIAFEVISRNDCNPAP